MTTGEYQQRRLTVTRLRARAAELFAEAERAGEAGERDALRDVAERLRARAVEIELGGAPSSQAL